MIRDLADSYLVVRELVGVPEKQEMADLLVKAWLAYADRVITGTTLTKPAPPPRPVVGEIDTFTEALRAAGYTDIASAWGKWGLDSMSDMDEEQKRNKLAAIRAHATVQHVSAVNPSEAPSMDNCPKCGSKGRKFDWGWGCSNNSCLKPNGKGTTWDQGNWSKIRFAVHGAR